MCVTGKGKCQLYTGACWYEAGSDSKKHSWPRNVAAQSSVLPKKTDCKKNSRKHTVASYNKRNSSHLLSAKLSCSKL